MLDGTFFVSWISSLQVILILKTTQGLVVSYNLKAKFETEKNLGMTRTNKLHR